MGDGRSGGGDTQNNAQNLQVLPKKISLHFFPFDGSHGWV